MWHNFLAWLLLPHYKNPRFVVPQSPCLSNLIIKIQSDELGINIVTVDYHTLVLCNSVSPTDCAMAEMATWWPLAAEAKVHSMARGVQNGTRAGFALCTSVFLSAHAPHLHFICLPLNSLCNWQCHYKTVISVIINITSMATMQTTW